jgi:hypothetical protein
MNGVRRAGCALSLLLAGCALSLLLAACALSLLLAGCAGASAARPAAADQSAATGQVSGRFVMDGGPMGPGGQQPSPRPIPGTVTFAAAGHPAVSVTVPAAGGFSVRLRPGRYQVTGRSPQVETVTGSGRAQQQVCSQPAPVTVTAGHAATVAVVCVVP